MLRRPSTLMRRSSASSRAWAASRIYITRQTFHLCQQPLSFTTQHEMLHAKYNHQQRLQYRFKNKNQLTILLVNTTVPFKIVSQCFNPAFSYQQKWHSCLELACTLLLASDQVLATLPMVSKTSYNNVMPNLKTAVLPSSCQHLEQWWLVAVTSNKIRQHNAMHCR